MTAPRPEQVEALAEALENVGRRFNHYCFNHQHDDGICRVCREHAAVILAAMEEAKVRCHADSDGDCSWSRCPQLLDKTGRHCPLDVLDPEQ